MKYFLIAGAVVAAIVVPFTIYFSPSAVMERSRKRGVYAPLMPFEREYKRQQRQLREGTITWITPSSSD